MSDEKSLTIINHCKNVVDSIMSSVQQSYDREKMIATCLSITGFEENLLEPMRRWIMDGLITYSTPSSKPIRAHFFLFNDLFLLCKPKKDKYVLLLSFKLKNSTLIPIKQGTQSFLLKVFQKVQDLKLSDQQDQQRCFLKLTLKKPQCSKL